MSRPAIFLDRDGTIIEDAHYVRDPDLVVLLPGAAEGLRRMREKGYLLFTISNQSGVGRGIISEPQFKLVHQRFVDLLAAEGVTLDGYLYCFHHPDENCECRKPKAGLIPKTVGGQAIDWSRSFTVGDKDCDVFLAEPIGAKAYLVLTGKGLAQREVLRAAPCPVAYKVCSGILDVANDLPDAARKPPR